MLLRSRSPLILALCVAVAACSADKPPEQAQAATDAAAVAKPSVRDPRAASTASTRAPAPGPTPVRAYETERSRQPMYTPRPLGFLECDQFAEKVTACVNSGALSAADMDTLGGEFRAAYNDIRFGKPDMVKACLDVQQSLQPRLIKAGCRNL